MEVQPIYCAEQIVVPAGLDEVLKHFTKEVIRKQPADLAAFGAAYFAAQAELQRSLHTVAVPSEQQLRDAYGRLRGAGPGVVPLHDVEMAARSAGINAATVASAVRAGGVNAARGVSALEVLLLLLTMRCGGLGAVLRGAFEVFGERGGGGAPGGEDSAGAEARLEVPVLLELLALLGARDPKVTPALREGVARALDGHVSVTLKGLAGVPVLASKLA
ncbi:MAG: hypothetical protein J3K34DRAFT_511552 [Monoraphidium minutum]|nr:MAG: hypothetical protein J3K34DRAFT_511552 [Monoraphidium minutum]